MIKNICVFASSSNYLADCFYKDAAELGKLLGQNGYNIVYGGSTMGNRLCGASKCGQRFLIRQCRC